MVNNALYALQPRVQGVKSKAVRSEIDIFLCHFHIQGWVALYLHLNFKKFLLVHSILTKTLTASHFTKKNFVNFGCFLK